MWAALFGSGGLGGNADGRLILHPSITGKQRVAGFYGGAELVLKTAAVGETVATLLDRLNTYRGPDQQLVRLWTPEGQELALSTPVRGTVIAEVRGESIRT